MKFEIENEQQPTAKVGLVFSASNCVLVTVNDIPVASITSTTVKELYNQFKVEANGYLWSINHDGTPVLLDKTKRKPDIGYILGLEP